MKVTCPKCGGALRVTDWKPHCPHCGVSIPDYNMQARLSADADAAELEFSRVQPVIDRIKASYIGSAKVIVRLVYALLPAAALFLPLAKIRYTAACAEPDLSLPVIPLIKLVTEHTKSASPLTVRGLSVPSVCAAAAILSIGCLLLTVLSLLVHAILLGGSCTQKGKRRLFVCDALLLLFGLCGLGAFLAFASAVKTALPGIIAAASPGVGVFIYLVMLLGVLIVDIAVIRSGIDVRYTPCYVGAVPAEEFRTLLEAGYTGEQIHAQYAAKQTAPVIT